MFLLSCVFTLSQTCPCGVICNLIDGNDAFILSSVSGLSASFYNDAFILSPVSGLSAGFYNCGVCTANSRWYFRYKGKRQANMTQGHMK